MVEKRFDFHSQPTPPEIHPAETVEDGGLRSMLEYWTSVKRDRRMPLRSDISPKAIGPRLRVVHIYDVVDGGSDFRARYVGSGVYPGLETDQTGKLVSEHPDPGVRLRFSLVLRHVMETKAPARSLSVRVTGSLLHDTRAEGLWLPLGEGDRVDQIFAQSSLQTIEPGTPGFAAKR